MELKIITKDDFKGFISGRPEIIINPKSGAFFFNKPLVQALGISDSGQVIFAQSPDNLIQYMIAKADNNDSAFVIKLQKNHRHGFTSKGLAQMFQKEFRVDQSKKSFKLGIDFEKPKARGGYLLYALNLIK